ncbi:anti-anti-sigma factor [Streptomyces maremycinicus]|nr:anti-anti-sigma factor [Streptomyces sp. B9173]
MTDIEEADSPKKPSAEQRVVDGVLVVTVHGEIDHTVKEILSKALGSEDGGTAQPSRIVADLGDVTFMDSSGLNVLILTHQRVREDQGWLRIAGAQPAVARLLHMVGIDEIVDCHPSVEQALSA